MTTKYPLYLTDCIKCGKSVYAKNSSFNKPNRKFCSKYCKISTENTTRVWKEESKKKLALKRITHGFSKDKLYKVYKEMISRCENIKSRAYKNYGQRGIKVHNEWFNYVTFKTWAESSGYMEGLTLDRTDNNSNYCPENCQWIPFSEQSKNRRPFSEWEKR